MLLRAAGSERVLSVNWDEITCRPPKGEFTRTCIQIADPLGGTREQTEEAFLASRNFSDLIARLQAIGAITLKVPAATQNTATVSLLDGEPTTSTFN